MLRKLHEFLASHRDDVVGGSIVLVIIAAIVVFIGSLMYATPEAEFIGTVEGDFITVLETPRTGSNASASSQWLLEVEAGANSVTAESLYLPDTGARLCLAHYDNGDWPDKYVAVGEVAIMASRGVACADWTPN